jgi:hypothetical protein
MEVVAHSISSPTFELFDTLRMESASDPQVAKKRAQLTAGTAPAGWTDDDGFLLFKGKLFVPDASSLWPALLAEAHGEGHEGVEKTLHRWCASFYSPLANRKVWEFVKGCAVCQRNKSIHLHPAGLLQPLPVPSVVWSDISMDFVEGFPKVGGKSVILTVVDRFSKYAHFIALGHPYSATSIAKAFFEGIMRLHGFPCSISSDRDVVFTSTFWAELFRLWGVELNMSSAFHLQSDGQSEVVNRVILMYLCCLVGDRPKTWLKWLMWAEYCYNASYQTTVKCSPFCVVYGCEPPTLLAYHPGTAKVAAVDHQLLERDEFLEEIRARLVQAQVTMKNVQDKSRRDMEFEVGSSVWVRLLQRTAVGVTTAAHTKLGPKFYGPFQIVQQIGSVSYRLQLPAKTRIHDVFHVALLKKFKGTPPYEVVSLPPILHGRILPVPEKVGKARLNRGVWEVLVHWLGRSATDTPWEQLEEFKIRYLEV